MEDNTQIEQKQPIQAKEQPKDGQAQSIQEKTSAPHQMHPSSPIFARPKQAERTRDKKKLMLESLVKSQGIVVYASQLAGINRRTHELWMDADPIYKAKVKQIEKDRLDAAESVVLETIARRAENPALALKAAIFTLEQLGSPLGYSKNSVQLNQQINTGTTLRLTIVEPKEPAAVQIDAQPSAPEPRAPEKEEKKSN